MNKKALSLRFIVLTVLLAGSACQLNEAPEPPTPDSTPPFTLNEVVYHLSNGQTGSGTFTINLDGSSNKRVPIPSSFDHNHHALSPSGTRLVVQSYIGNHSLYLFNIDGSQQTRLTTPNGVTDVFAAWSPNGQTIVFTRYPSETVNEPEEAELWLVNADGSILHSLGINGDLAQWSADGSRLIYVAWVSGNHEIFTCLADGSQEIRLTQTNLDESWPSWSHNGRQITFAASSFGDISGQSSEIFLMNADGSNMVRLTNNNYSDSTPRWSHDDTQLLFVSAATGPDQSDIYLMNTDGSNVRRVTSSVPPATASEPVWCPRSN